MRLGPQHPELVLVLLSYFGVLRLEIVQRLPDFVELICLRCDLAKKSVESGMEWRRETH
jgi:hypothetical protein